MKYIAPAVTCVHSALGVVHGVKDQLASDSSSINFTSAAAYEADE